MLYDIIIVVAGRDHDVAKIAIPNCIEFLFPDNVFLICPANEVEVARSFYSEFSKVKVISEESVLDCSNFNWNAFDIPGFPERSGWYYQQFLKMAFALSGFSSNRHYLIWDADTIPLNSINFFDSAGRIFLTRSPFEYHIPYFSNINNLFHGQVPTQATSFISQHSMINVQHMKEMLNEISEGRQSNWVSSLLSVLEGDGFSLFSEYETYAAYCLYRYPDSYCPRNLRWFRRAGFIYRGSRSLRSMARYYDFVAIEKGDNPNSLKAIYFWFRHLRNVLVELFRRG